MRVWITVLVLALTACAKPAERITWSKEGDTVAAREHAEAECATASGVPRITVPYAGTIAGPPRGVDPSGRGREAYNACMETKGYSRAPDTEAQK